MYVGLRSVIEVTSNGCGADRTTSVGE